MSAVLLDTNIVSYIMNRHTLAYRYRQHLAGQTLAVSFATVAELFEGAFKANWSPERFVALEESLRSYVIVPYSVAICREWGRIRVERRRQPISPNDAWIAATALAVGHPLITHNLKDFEGIAGLTVISEQ